MLASLEIQMHVARKRLYLERQEVTEFDRMEHTSVLSVCLIKFGRVYLVEKVVVSPGEERIIQGKVHSNTPEPVTSIGIVNVLDEFTERSSLLGCSTVAEEGKEKIVPARVLNISGNSVTIHKGQSVAEFTEATVAGLGDERQQGATRMSATAYDPVTESTLGDSLSVEERQRLESLLRQYRNVFAYPGNDGHVTDIEHTIPLTKDDTIVCRPRRLPTQLKAEVETEVQNFPQRGIIRSTVSGYDAPVCPVKKKRRYFTSLRRLSRSKLQNKRYGYTYTGNLLEVVESMAGVRYFSAIDLAHGYYQVWTVESDMEKTAFRVPSGLRIYAYAISIERGTSYVL